MLSVSLGPESKLDDIRQKGISPPMKEVKGGPPHSPPDSPDPPFRSHRALVEQIEVRLRL